MNSTTDDIIIHPERGRNEKKIPPCGLLLVNPTESRIATKLVLDGGGDRRFLFHSELVVSRDNDFFVAGPAIGAPMAAMTIEKLIALGAQHMVLFGWCGAVNSDCRVGDVLLGGEAYCGEGTSAYYTGEQSCFPSHSLSKRLQVVLNLSSPKTMWTTDAVFRESRAMLQALAGKYDVCGVDMEYSALCSVAAFRNIELTGLFLVSDELWRSEWRPGFASKAFKRKSRQLIELLLTKLPLMGTAQEE